jgi:FAD:protein FMN transferase
MVKFLAWGMTGTLALADQRGEADAFEVLEQWITRIDATCNRFRKDSELSVINRSAGGSYRVSRTLETSLIAARRASDATGGLCDPTILPALETLGYDRDFSELADGVGDGPSPTPAPGPDGWHIDVERHLLVTSEGTRLDLGASVKSWLADVVVAELAGETGALVEIGGDLATRGEGPMGPWRVGVAERLEIRGNEPTIVPSDGGVATSSTTERSWRRGSTMVNHIIDPRTGRSADGPIVTATVVASDCVTANALATASLLWGEGAATKIQEAGASARLVARDGSVRIVGAWPGDESP